MVEHLIITGSPDDIDKSLTLNRIVENSEGVDIVNWLGDEDIKTVFDPSNFAITTDTVLVYINAVEFDFIDFYFHHLSKPQFLKNDIGFVFLVNYKPFKRTTSISKRFKVLSVKQNDYELGRFTDPQLQIARLKRNIRFFQNEIEHTPLTNWSEADKEQLHNYFKKQMLDNEQDLWQLRKNEANEILREIGVKA